jgi:hypothetical protein
VNGESVPVLLEIYFMCTVNCKRLSGTPFQSLTVLNALKLATMIGIGRVMHKTPQMAHKEATSFPPAVVGATSP